MIGPDVQVSFGLTHVRRHLVNDAGRLQQAHRFVVEVHRARQRMRLGLLLQHQRLQAGSAEQVRGQGAYRATADHDDVKLGRRRHGASPAAQAASLGRIDLPTCWLGTMIGEAIQRFK